MPKARGLPTGFTAAKSLLLARRALGVAERVEQRAHSLSDFVAAATVASNERLRPGVRVRLPDHDVEGVVEAIDTDEVHVRTDDGDLTHVPNGDFVGERWTTVNEE